MLQCKDCEFFEKGADGQMHFRCDPFEDVREPECVLKWQLLQMESLTRMYQETMEQCQKLAPLQERMFKAMEREVSEMEEAERWKWAGEENEPEENEEDLLPPPTN